MNQTKNGVPVIDGHHAKPQIPSVASFPVLKDMFESVFTHKNGYLEMAVFCLRREKYSPLYLVYQRYGGSAWTFHDVAPYLHELNLPGVQYDVVRPVDGEMELKNYWGYDPDDIELSKKRIIGAIAEGREHIAAKSESDRVAIFQLIYFGVLQYRSAIVTPGITQETAKILFYIKYEEPDSELILCKYQGCFDVKFFEQIDRIEDDTVSSELRKIVRKGGLVLRDQNEDKWFYRTAL